MIGTIVKTGLGTVSNLGIGVMMGEATKRLIPEGAGKAVKICCYVGGSMTSCCVGWKVQEYIDDLVDDTAAMGKQLFKRKKKDDEKVEKVKAEVVK